MIRKFTFNKSIWLYIFLLISSFKITNAKDLNSFRTNGGYMGIVNGNPSTMVLSVPELNDNTAVKNAYTISNKITPLDSVLRACVSTTPVTVGSTMSATVTGNNTASGYTTQFVLLDATNKIVAGPQVTASFAATVPGIFKIVAVNHNGSVTGLTLGQNISSISGTCWEISAPKCFDVQSVTCSSPIQIVLGNALTATITGNNTTLGYTTQYVLTDANDVIVQGPLSTANFIPTVTGIYKIYAINYSGTVTGLTQGTNFLTGVTGSCVAKSAPKCFTLICPTVTNIASDNANPTSCGASDGSIKICGLPANSTGWTVTYDRNSVAASALAGQTTDVNGCITISGLSAGSYSNIKVSSAGCISTNSLNVNLSDPSSPSSPSGLNAISNSLCTGSNTALSATGISGASYVWSVSPSGASLASGSGIVNGITASNTLSSILAGTYTVSVTQTVSGCTSPPSTTVVVVNGLSTAPSVVGGGTLSNICPSVTADLTTKQPSVVSGQTYEWHTVSSNPNISTKVSNPSAAAAGTYYLYSISTVGNCYSPASSTPVIVSITSCSCTPIQVVIGSALTANISGNNTTPGYTTQYVLTDANDVIVQGPTTTASFTPTVTGNYKIYAINYSGTVTGLIVGTNFLTGVSGSCMAKSAPKCFTVIGNPDIRTVKTASTTAITAGVPFSYTLTPNNVSTVASSGVITIKDTLQTGLTYNNFTGSGWGCTVSGQVVTCTSSTVINGNSSGTPLVLNVTPSSSLVGTSVTNTAWTSGGGMPGGPYKSGTTPTNAGGLGSPASGTPTVITAVCQTPTLVSASPATICAGSSSTLSANCITGTIAWYADAALTSLVSSQVSPTATTTYYGVCENGTCKSLATSVVVNVTPAIALTNSNFSRTNPTSCAGSQGTIKICGLVANTNYSASFNKNGAPQTSGSLLSDATGCITLTNLMAGTYDNFNVTNTATTCSSGTVPSASLVLTDPSSAFITVGTTQNPSACGLNDGFIQINGLTAGTAYTVNYMQNGMSQTPLSITASGTAYVLSGLTAANYTNITVTSGSCISNPLSRSLVDPITSTITLGAKTDPTTCSGNEGTFTVSGLSPNTAYVLNYSKDGFVQTPIAFTSTSTSYIVSGLLSGSYTNIRVTSMGCTSNIVSTTLTDPSAAVIALGTPNNPTTCSGTNGSLTINGLAIGTVYTIKYKKDGVWQTPITITATTSSYTITGLSSGSYTNINVTNNSCVSNSLSQMLVDPLPPVIGMGTITQPNSCGANNGSVIITGLTTGLNYTLNYLKDGVQQAPVSFTATGTTYTLSDLVAGNYTGINVKQSTCVSNTLNVSLSNPGGAIIDVFPINPISCSPGNDGKIILTGLAQGLNYILNYTKNGVAQTPIPIAASSTSYIINGLTAGVYTNITVTQANCVSNVVNATLVSPTLSAPVASVNGGMTSVIICSGGTAALSATGCSSGTIIWTSSPVSTVPSNGIVSPTITTTYTATCTNGSCVSPASNSVTVTLGLCANPDGIIATVPGTKSIIPILGNDKNSDGTQADLAKITVPVVTTMPSKGTAVVNPDGTISYTPNQGTSGTDTFIYTICDKVNPSVCDTAKVTILINAILDVKLQLKVFLQGAFFSPSGATDALMRDDLRRLSVIPTVEPFAGMNNSRFTKASSDNGGQTIGTGVLTTEGSDAIVDWVFVELRDASNPATILKTRAALVQRDGDVVEASDGTTPVTFTGAVGTNYYVSVKHRNHLGAMTATPITMAATGTIVDFTTMTAAQLWDKGLVLTDGSLGSYNGSEQVTLGNGKMGLWAGNANNNDNKVKYSGTSPDPAAILSQVITFSGNTAQSYNYDFVTPVYLTGDINMDGKVKYQGTSTDTAFILFNIINKYPNNLAYKTYNFDFMVEQIP